MAWANGEQTFNITRQRGKSALTTLKSYATVYSETYERKLSEHVMMLLQKAKPKPTRSIQHARNVRDTKKKYQK